MRSHLLSLGTIVAAAVLVYSNTFDVPFTFDDDQHLVEGTAMSRSVPAALAACAEQNRCIGFATFAANYAVDGLAVRGYHAVNLVIHACSGLLVYAFALLLLRTPRLRSSRLATEGRWVALGAALLFVVHPLQTMAVTYLVQRFASLMAFFYLASLVSWLSARLSPSPAVRLRPALYLVSLAAAALAMKTKENAVTLPLAVALLELSFFEGPSRPRLARLAPWVLCLVLPAATMLGIASREGGVAAALRSNTPMTRLAYLSTELTVVPAYLRLMVFPTGLSIDHRPPTWEEPWHPAPLAGLVLLTVLFAVAVRFVWRPPRGERALVLVGFGVLWFFLTLAVESSLLPIKDVMVEHRVYLPSVGLFLSVAMGWVMVSRTLGSESRAAARAFTVIAAGSIVGLGAIAYARNEVWRDEPELWRRAIAQAPDEWLHYANTNAGQALLERGRCPEAIPYFEAAHARDGTQLVPLLNLGLCHASLGDRVRARQRFEQAMALDPRDGRAPEQLARLSSEDGDLVVARALYERALELKPGPAVRAGLGATLGQLGMLEEARAQLERSVAEAPGSAMAWGNLGNVRSLQGDQPGAEEAWRRALLCDPADAAARANLSRVLQQRGAPPLP